MLKIINYRCVSSIIQEELKLIDYSQANIEVLLQDSCMKKLKKGKVEDFYSNFYGNIILRKNKENFPMLTNSSSTLLLSKLSDKLIITTKEDKQEETVGFDILYTIAENEIGALQYISGYDIIKLYKRKRVLTMKF